MIMCDKKVGVSPCTELLYFKKCMKTRMTQVLSTKFDKDEQKHSLALYPTHSPQQVKHLLRFRLHTYCIYVATIAETTRSVLNQLNSRKIVTIVTVSWHGLGVGQNECVQC